MDDAVKPLVYVERKRMTDTTMYGRVAGLCVDVDQICPSILVQKTEILLHSGSKNLFP